MAKTLEDFFGDDLVLAGRGASKNVRDAFDDAITKQIAIASKSKDDKKGWWRTDGDGYKISPKWQGLTVMQSKDGKPAALNCGKDNLNKMLKKISDANSEGLFDKRLEDIRTAKKSARASN